MKRDSVSVYIHMRRDALLPPYAPVHILDDPASFPQLFKYLIDGVTLNQKTNKTIRISYSLKYKYSKTRSLLKNKW